MCNPLYKPLAKDKTSQAYQNLLTTVNKMAKLHAPDVLHGVCVCVCVYVCEREKKRERESEQGKQF